MITFLILWAIAEKQDETNRILRMTPEQLEGENAKRRVAEQTEIGILWAIIILLPVIGLLLRPILPY